MTEDNLEFLSLKGGCTGSSESTLVKMSHCWRLHVANGKLNGTLLCLPEQMLVMITIISYPVVFPFSHYHSRSETSSWVHAGTREFNLLKTIIYALLTIIQCTCAYIYDELSRPVCFLK